ncbi:MAG: Sigma-54 dependent DNA-binding transcriptional regulator [uncultured Paraburkholderia sp.]|nr:MAG: Sigma-54 dependent DNA-binding transcriptional regulator [uncultured Paraburkholderia sp.]CAH2939079.1 MAG: Sigma-54 dependent DNA-binding transcriptional regulator [uncultured Paraburkholderia sp.]
MRESPHLTSVAPLAAAGAPLTRAVSKETPAVVSLEIVTGRPSANTLSLAGGPAAAPRVRAERVLLCVARTPDEALLAHLKSRGWNVTLAHSAHELGRLVKPDLASAGIIDLASFPPRDIGGFESSLRHQQIGWIALASEERLNDPLARQLVRHYCFDYVKLPTAPVNVDYLVGHAFGMVNLYEPDLAPPVAPAGNDEMVGTCEAMQQLFHTIRKVANTDASMFISGESGTGKELTALAIHERSPRRKAPFIAINCGAIPHHLLQSELFGYERGEFTGANQRKIGRVEAADGGTLPLESQASLLRFLQEGKIERLGERESIPVDVLIISATHVDLEGAMREGQFRADLFHRLCVLRVDEPPLRARGKDIEILAHHILHKFKADGARKIRGFAPSAIEALYNYNWPGNVRELINRVCRAVVMAENKLISADDLDLANFAAQETMASRRLARPPKSARSKPRCCGTGIG